MKINVATAIYPENKRNGIMICGYNWGGSPDEQQIPEELSFFSNEKTNNYPYRNRILEWFRLWGHPLNTSKSAKFEQSIIQTNWCPSQSINMNNTEFAECLKHIDNFVFHVEYFKPKLILFMGIKLLDALNDKDCIPYIRQVLGNESQANYQTKDIIVDGKPLRKFRIGFQKFETCDVIALPHPSGSKGLHYEYIKAFKDQISPKLENYKTKFIK